MTNKTFLLGTALAALYGCNQLNSPVARHSSSLVLSANGQELYVVNADSDSLSIIDTGARSLKQEVQLGSATPTTDSNGRYTPAVFPRTVAISPHANRLYIAGERAGQVLVVNASTGVIENRITVGSEPAGVLVSPDETSVYVTCSNDSEVMKIDTSSLKVVSTTTTAPKPWGLAWSSDAKTLYVSHLLGADNPSTPGPGVTVLNPTSMKITSTWNIPDVQPRGNDASCSTFYDCYQAGFPNDICGEDGACHDSRLAYGQARGLYDAVARPGSNQLWVPHLMLANQTPQLASDLPPPTQNGTAPAAATPLLLDFETTVFPTLTVFDTSGKLTGTLSTNAQDIPGVNGAFGDVVSGPHNVVFTSDGKYALVVDTNSEDVLAVDASNQVEAALLRPLPGHMPEGIVLSSDNKLAFVDERNTGDIAVIDVDESASPIGLTVEANVIPRFKNGDPMPSAMRSGQHIFFSANSDEMPITQNHWIACNSCHVEGRSDAVTWKFTPGPRDTPSNAGGLLGTGLLLHTAARLAVQDYWHVINIEQGGDFSPTVPAQQSELNELEAFLDYALPAPIPPTTDPTLVAQGKQVFMTAGCNNCHNPETLYTDSGANQPLSLSTPVLHDVGTCNTGSFPDVPNLADDGSTREPCAFDTPALRGIADSAPYFHDGSAATLDDVIQVALNPKCNGRAGCVPMGNLQGVSQNDLNALKEFLRSL